MVESPKTRSSLMLRLRTAQDQEAWSEFVAIYEPLILRLMKRQGLQDSDARDVCQEVLADVAHDVEQWRPDGQDASFRRWLFRIARNRVLKFLVRERKRFAVVDENNAQLCERPDHRESITAEFEIEYRRQVLFRAAEQIRHEFQQQTWNAFWQTCIEDRGVAEVAAELETTIGNVYVARSRIMARLKAVADRICRDDE